jgi:hypothetical protein
VKVVGSVVKTVERDSIVALGVIDQIVNLRARECIIATTGEAEPLCLHRITYPAIPISSLVRLFGKRGLYDFDAPMP